MTDPVDMLRIDLAKALEGLLEKHSQTMINLKDAYMEDGSTEMRIWFGGEHVELGRRFSITLSIDPVEDEGETSVEKQWG